MKKEFGVSKELKKQFTRSIASITIIGLLCLILGIYSVYAKLKPATIISLLFVGTAQLLSAWLTARIVKTTRLIFTSEKLEFHSPGLVLVTSWDNLERIGKIAAYDSLVLRAAATQNTAWWFQLFRKRFEREIPMSMFSNWRVSEIGQEIRKYAPHLFSDSVASK